YVGKSRLRVGRNRRMLVDGLGSIIVAEQVLPRRVKSCVFLEVVRPIGNVDGIQAFLGRFDRVLINGCVNKAQVVNNLGCLGTLARTEESGDSNGGEQSYDRHHNHDFHEGEAPVFRGESLEHTRSSLSIYYLVRDARWRDFLDLVLTTHSLPLPPSRE